MQAKPTAMKRRGKFLKNKDDALMFAMLAPAVIAVFVISIIPLIYTFFLSFQDYTLTKPQDRFFSGLANYVTVFTDRNVLQSIGNTIVFTLCSVVISLLIGLLLASLVNNVKKGKTFFRIAIFTPMMFSAVVVGVIWRFLFNNEMGVLNYITSSLGLGRVNWLGNPSMAMFSVIMADVWQWSSYTFILALAGLESINPEPVEAATIDGAGAVSIYWNVKLPSLMPVIEVAAVFRFIWAFRSFDLIYALTTGGPGTSTETMALEVWRQAFTRYDIGVSSAISVLMFVLLMCLSVFILRGTMKKD